MDELQKAFEEYNRVVLAVLDEQIRMMKMLNEAVEKRAAEYLYNATKLIKTKDELEDFIAKIKEYIEKHQGPLTTKARGE